MSNEDVTDIIEIHQVLKSIRPLANQLEENVSNSDNEELAEKMTEFTHTLNELSQYYEENILPNTKTTSNGPQFTGNTSTLTPVENKFNDAVDKITEVHESINNTSISSVEGIPGYGSFEEGIDEVYETFVELSSAIDIETSDAIEDELYQKILEEVPDGFSVRNDDEYVSINTPQGGEILYYKDGYSSDDGYKTIANPPEEWVETEEENVISQACKSTPQEALARVKIGGEDGLDEQSYVWSEESEQFSEAWNSLDSFNKITVRLSLVFDNHVDPSKLHGLNDELVLVNQELYEYANE